MERERQTVECSPGPSGFCGCASKRPAWWTHCFSSIQAFWLADSAYLSTDLLWYSWYFTVFIRKICSKLPSPAWVQQRTGRHPKKGRGPFYVLDQLPAPTLLPLHSGSLSFPSSSNLFRFEITMFWGVKQLSCLALWCQLWEKWEVLKNGTPRPFPFLSLGIVQMERKKKNTRKSKYMKQVRTLKSHRSGLRWRRVTFKYAFLCSHNFSTLVVHVLYNQAE